MKILSVNAGSSSLKFQMYEMPEEKVLISGVFERIGIGDSFYTLKINGNKIKKEADLPDHEAAVNIVLNELLENNIISDLNEIKGVGHRLVHGADEFSSSVVLNEDVLKKIEKFNDLAPLHNPANIMGVRAFMKAIPNAIEVGCFDTAFHQTMSEERYLYPIPYELYEKYKIRKYGFHGMSHRYISERINQILGRYDTNVIVCHLGNGGSLSAIKNGKCVDTTMGFTPNAGIMMGSRSGDIDYSIIPYLMKNANMSIDEIDNMLNKKSGLLGISNVSSDFRDIVSEVNKGNEKAILAHIMFINRVCEYIAKYYIELGKVDAICFTAGIGENNAYIRGKIVQQLNIFGIKIYKDKNENTCGIEGIITTDDSSVPCYVIPTDEEVMIARDTVSLL